MHWVDLQQRQHRLDWIESVLLLLQLCGGGKSQCYMAGLAASSAAFYVCYQYQCELRVDAGLQPYTVVHDHPSHISRIYTYNCLNCSSKRLDWGLKHECYSNTHYGTSLIRRSIAWRPHFGGPQFTRWSVRRSASPGPHFTRALVVTDYIHMHRSYCPHWWRQLARCGHSRQQEEG